MEESQERWRRPGIRLAVVVLAGIGLYFLVIFVRQSINLYNLGQEVEARAAQVTQMAQQNLALKERLESYLDEEGRQLLVKKNLPYIGSGDQVVVLAAGVEPPVEDAPARPADPAAGLVDLPGWQQWVRLVFP